MRGTDLAATTSGRVWAAMHGLRENFSGKE